MVALREGAAGQRRERRVRRHTAAVRARAGALTLSALGMLRAAALRAGARRRLSAPAPCYLGGTRPRGRRRERERTCGPAGARGARGARERGARGTHRRCAHREECLSSLLVGVFFLGKENEKA